MKCNPKVWHLAALAILGNGVATEPEQALACSFPTEQIRVEDQEVRVNVSAGIAQTEVTQQLSNPNPIPVEAIFQFDVPENAALGEVHFDDGVHRLQGEIVRSEAAKDIYEHERSYDGDTGCGKGRGAGDGVGQARLTQDGELEIRIGSLAADAKASVRFTYYQPIEIRDGIATYTYPGGNAEANEADVIWPPNGETDGGFKFTFDLRTSRPVPELKIQGYEQETKFMRMGLDHHRLTLNLAEAPAEVPLTIQYPLPVELNGRVDLIGYRESSDEPGAFMATFSPGSEFLLDPEVLQDAEINFSGTRVFGVVGAGEGRLHIGDQVTVFGRYLDGGRARVELKDEASDLTHFASILNFPGIDSYQPEVERLWAAAQAQWIERRRDEGDISAATAEQALAEIGEEYQILTGGTVMVLADDEVFARHDLAREGALRNAKEQVAQTLRDHHPAWDNRADLARPFFVKKNNAPTACCIAPAKKTAGLSDLETILSRAPVPTPSLMAKVR